MASQAPPAPASGRFELPAHVNRIVDTFIRGVGPRGDKRKRFADVSENNENDALRLKTKTDYRDYGRRFTRLGEPFSKIVTIVERGLEIENMDSEDEDQDRTETEKQKHLSSDWKILCGIIPLFRDDAVALAEQRQLRRGICLQINSGVDKARSDDTNGLKSDILGYLHLDPLIPLDPPILRNDPNKSLRGWNHPTTAALITPIELAANDLTYAEVKCGRRRITANQMPRFLYPDGHLYNEDDIEDGLFRGHLIIRAVKHVYCGPGSVFQPVGYEKGRPSIGRIIEMERMTPRALAYVAVQTHFAISDGAEWHVLNRHVNYERLFWNLVELLDGDEGQAILTFYDQEVLGIPDESSLQDIPGDVAIVSVFDRIREQRAAKRIREDGPASAGGPAPSQPIQGVS